MSMRKYKESWEWMEPSEELHTELVDTIMKEQRKTRRRLLRPGVLAACAAVLILCVSMTAAASFNMNEIFHGFFQKEELVQKSESAGQTTEVPLDGEDGFLLSAGNAIHAETEGNGLKLTARGTVADGNALFVAIDVETQDGSPFSQEQEGTLQSYQFDKVKLQTEGQDMRYCWLERIDDGSVPGKTTFLLSETLEGDLKGKQVSLSFSDFLMYSDKVIDLGMEKTVWELMQEFKPLTGEMVFQSGSGSSSDVEGNVTYHEEFMSAKTDRRIPFSSTYPEATFSNLGLWEGTYGTHLLANLELGGALDFSLLEQKGMRLVDRTTGQELLDGDIGAGAVGNGAEKDYFPDSVVDQADIIGDAYVSARLDFANVSMESLKNAVFVLGGDGTLEELFKGDWELNFTVDYEETMKTWALSEPVAVGNVIIDEIQISPVSAALNFYTLSDEQADFEDAVLNLKNGIRIEAEEIRWEDCGTEGGTCQILWKYVVDMGNIESISVNGTVITL